VFTLVRLSSAVLLAVFSYFAAQAYQPLYDPDMNSPAFLARMTMFGAVVGWLFLGRHAGRKLWLSAYMGVQAVALTAILGALVFGVREVFILGYRRRISEPMDAILAIPEQALNFLLIAMERDFLLLLGGGGVLLGMLVHLVARTTDRRRLHR
jgi:ABC-type dipeptide/oligopeptide/nickel transport system permease subunit